MGDYVPNGNEFPAMNWLWSTNTFINRIKGLSSENWTAVFDTLQQLQDADADAANIEAGAITQECHEPLLPNDPPSLPSA